uniref:C2H2-type domain-containing protein n=1 Tax=Sinocyclocheilus grahami TaxID=75366 RepID=A0A672QF10_SINGR
FSRFTFHIDIHYRVPREKLFACTYCGKVFNRPKKVVIHQRIHTGEKPFKCNTCGKFFSEAGNLRKHQKVHTGERPYVCKYCGKAFTGLSNVVTHQRVHTGERPFKCDTCGKLFTEAGNLKKHQRVHTGEKPFICPRCGKRFRYWLALHPASRHGVARLELSEAVHERSTVVVRRHPERKVVRLADCVTVVKLPPHAEACPGENMAAFCVETEDKKLVFAAEKEIPREKLFACTYCGKVFNRPKKVVIHQRIHTGEKPFKCNTCGKFFSEAGNLRKHQKVHTGERPYSCSQCGQTFAWIRNLKNHQQNIIHPNTCLIQTETAIRTNPSYLPQIMSNLTQPGASLAGLQLPKHMEKGRRKSYVCKYCGKAFTGLSNVVTHQRVHTGERPFKCDTCGKLFTEAGNLKKHQRVHTGEKPFVCPRCGKRFAWICNLKTHQQSACCGGV